MEHSFDLYDPEEKMAKIVRLLKSVTSQHNYTAAFSGGKDSVVLAWFLKEANANVPLVYNLTTIDPPGTTSFCKKWGAEIRIPNETFLQLVERKGLPTMFHRFCCQYLKEQFISEYLFTGVRRSESVKRSKRYCTFESIRRYNKNTYTAAFHPLLFLTNDDISYIVNTRQLECHPLYYDEQLFFHCERRLGCIGCPLQSDRGRDDYKQNQRLFSQVVKRVKRFHLSHGRSEKDAYLNIAYVLFYSNHGYKKFEQTFHGLFATDPKAFLQSQFPYAII